MRKACNPGVDTCVKLALLMFKGNYSNVALIITSAPAQTGLVLCKLATSLQVKLYSFFYFLLKHTVEIIFPQLIINSDSD